MDTTERHERLKRLPIQPNPALVEAAQKRADQNRADAKRQVVANLDSNQILESTKAIHARDAKS